MKLTKLTKRNLNKNYQVVVVIFMLVALLASLLLIAGQNSKLDREVEANRRRTTELIRELQRQHDSQDAKFTCMIKLFARKEPATVRDVERCIIEEERRAARRDAQASDNGQANSSSPSSPNTSQPGSSAGSGGNGGGNGGGNTPPPPPPPPPPENDDGMVIEIIEDVINDGDDIQILDTNTPVDNINL